MRAATYRERSRGSHWFSQLLHSLRESSKIGFRHQVPQLIRCHARSHVSSTADDSGVSLSSSDFFSVFAMFHALPKVSLFLLTLTTG